MSDNRPFNLSSWFLNTLIGLLFKVRGCQFKVKVRAIQLRRGKARLVPSRINTPHKECKLNKMKCIFSHTPIEKRINDCSNFANVTLEFSKRFPKLYAYKFNLFYWNL